MHTGEVDQPGYLYSCYHQTVIIDQAIRRSRWGWVSVLMPSPNWHYQLSNQEKSISLGICTHAVTQLSLSTKQSGEVDQPGICTHIITQLSLLTKQSGEVDQPGYLYSWYHPTVIIGQAIRRSRWVWLLEQRLSSNCSYQLRNQEK